MSLSITTSGKFAVAAAMAAALPLGASAQDYENTDPDRTLTVYATVPADIAELPDGPELEGYISARKDERMQVTTIGGQQSVVFISEATEIRSRGGFLGLSRTSLGADALMNGLPVKVETKQWSDGLIASRVRLSNDDLETATMIRTGTAQGFAEQTAATEALRGRVGDIDNYLIKDTTNVYFDSGKWRLDGEAQRDLCQAAAQAEATDNALLLVVGYTDADGSEELNQELSERRAARVTNYLQQECGWKPWRMLTPTGMAEADPAADNYTPQGKAQNRRVAVNILVSKAVEGL
ncbi:OmpA family protein [Erythrobacter litoralis]|uniref:OmpA-like domain-containing protein n=1 Tax=Erythrobacter litoralis (strain HTCC2594) TaxID=314225 RepID=Q2N783_ERYLH|nr:OmpA family protein [Erythrobacter litoralis]ABC64458.1 hypothetical protein ELI_11830 [Erythrobacter litoralis HTCC2594]